MGASLATAHTGYGERRLIGIRAPFRSRMAAERGGIPHSGRQTAGQSKTRTPSPVDSSKTVCCLTRETLWRRGDFRSVGQTGWGSGTPKQGEVGVLRKGFHLFSRSSISLLVQVAVLPFSADTYSQQHLLLLHHVVVPVAIVSLPPPSPQFCKQAPHPVLAPASPGKAPPDNRRRPSRRAVQRVLPLGHDKQCQDSRLVQLG